MLQIDSAAPVWARRYADDVARELAVLRASLSARLMVLRATVARTDTAAKNLFAIPARARPLALILWSSAASDAGTTATLSIGKTGSATFYLNAHDVKTAASGRGQVLPNLGLNLHAVELTPVQVIGTYAETGVASTTGGPWSIVMPYAFI